MAEFQEPTDNDKTLAIFAHVGGFFTSFLVPAILMLTAKNEPDEPPTFSSVHARESLKFQITLYFQAGLISLISFLFGGTAFLLVGVTASVLLSTLILTIAIAFFMIVLETLFVILACLAAKRGEMYRYPLTLRFI